MTARTQSPSDPSPRFPTRVWNLSDLSVMTELDEEMAWFVARALVTEGYLEWANDDDGGWLADISDDEWQRIVNNGMDEFSDDMLTETLDEIVRDMIDGVVPPTVDSWAALADHVDPRKYGRRCYSGGDADVWDMNRHRVDVILGAGYLQDIEPKESK